MVNRCTCFFCTHHPKLNACLFKVINIADWKKKAGVWKLTAFILVLMLYPTQLMALDWKVAVPYTMLVTGQSLDAVSTVRFLHGTKCVEGNPLFGEHPKSVTIVAAKGGIVLTSIMLQRFAEHRESKAAKIIARSLSLLAGGVGMKDGITNFRGCGW